MISDEDTVKLLAAEIQALNGERAPGEAEWPLEPVEIRKQSSHFWEAVSNVGSSERSLTILIDPQRGRVLKGRPRFKVLPGGQILVKLIPTT